MRILLLSHVPDDPDGGASRVYHLLADGLRARGHMVQLYHREAMRLPSDPILSRVAVRLALPRYVSRFGVAAGGPFDIVMASNGTAAPLFARLRARAERPLLVNHVHGLAAFDHRATLDEHRRGHGRVSLAARLVTGPLQAWWDDRGVRTADLTIVQNRRDLAAVQERLPASAQVRLIPPAIHPGVLAASVGARPADKRAPVLLWFAAWQARKGCHHLPAAFALIRARHPGARLMIGGTGSAGARVASLFAGADRHAITVLPRISVAEQSALFATSSVLIFPSLSEGFGLALAEAMCFGVAAVAGRTGFAADALTDHVHARLVEPDSVGIANAVGDLLDDPAARARIAAAGRDAARALTVERMAADYEAAFLEAIERRRAAALRPVSLIPSYEAGHSSEKIPMPGCDVALPG